MHAKFANLQKILHTQNKSKEIYFVLDDKTISNSLELLFVCLGPLNWFSLKVTLYLL